MYKTLHSFPESVKKLLVKIAELFFFVKSCVVEKVEKSN